MELLKYIIGIFLTAFLTWLILRHFRLKDKREKGTRAVKDLEKWCRDRTKRLYVQKQASDIDLKACCYNRSTHYIDDIHQQRIEDRVYDQRFMDALGRLGEPVHRWSDLCGKNPKDHKSEIKQARDDIWHPLIKFYPFVLREARLAIPRNSNERPKILKTPPFGEILRRPLPLGLLCRFPWLIKVPEVTPPQNPDND